MSLIRRGIAFVLVLLGTSAICADARAQSAGDVDTMRLDIVPPDSVYVRRDGQNVVIGWYPPRAEIGSIAGSRHWTNWRGPDPNISEVTITGTYSSDVNSPFLGGILLIDRTLKVGRVAPINVVTVDTIGVERSIPMEAQLRDAFDTYNKKFDVGTDHYTPGDTVQLILIGEKWGFPLDLGIGLTFSAGIVDTIAAGPGRIQGPAFFEVDLQALEGFHIWRGVSPKPSQMSVISEFSMEDAFIGIIREDIRSFSFQTDADGRLYWEYVDRNAFPGFTYYYIVTCFDRGYFKGKTEFNKRDNFICYENWSDPSHPNPAPCEDVGKIITVTVGAGTDMRLIFAVPNPYRTGTSAETHPFYHNYPDGSIKFFNVPKEADIKIYTVSGDLIWEAHHSSSTGENGIISWDVKNQRGQDVGSGVYLYRCKNSADGSDAYGKLVVIR